MNGIRQIIIGVWALCMALPLSAQTHADKGVKPEDRQVNMQRATFEPSVKVGKVLLGTDSIQYVELNNIYVYPTPTFKNERQRAKYNRLVYNIKKVLDRKSVV